MKDDLVLLPNLDAALAALSEQDALHSAQARETAAPRPTDAVIDALLDALDALPAATWDAIGMRLSPAQSTILHRYAERQVAILRRTASDQNQSPRFVRRYAAARRLAGIRPRVEQERQHAETVARTLAETAALPPDIRDAIDWLATLPHFVAEWPADWYERITGFIERVRALPQPQRNHVAARFQARRAGDAMLGFVEMIPTMLEQRRDPADLDRGLIAMAFAQLAATDYRDVVMAWRDVEQCARRLGFDLAASYEAAAAGAPDGRDQGADFLRQEAIAERARQAQRSPFSSRDID